LYKTFKINAIARVPWYYFQGTFLKRLGMNKVMILLIFIVFSCKSGKDTTFQMDKDQVLMHYSKVPCLGKCPVYELWIFNDGTVLYKGINKVARKGEIKSRLSSEEISDLVLLLEHNLTEPKAFKKVRDLPVTRLRYGQKKFGYHVSKIDVRLKEVNSAIEDLVEQAQSNYAKNQK